MIRQKSTPMEPSLLLNSLHIFSLSALVIAYPVFSFLRANPGYILVNGIRPQVLYTITGVVSLGLPLALLLMLLLIRSIWPSGYWKTQCALVTVLAALSFLTLVSGLDINRMEVVPQWLNFLVVAVFTFIAIHEYRTNRFTYVALAVFAPLALIFPAHFLSDTNIRQLLSPESTSEFIWERNDSEELPPIFMIVYDEFPLIHLLDAEGDIDAARFPHFAGFAEGATWYSNATTVHDYTLKAVSSILTGRFPIPGGAMPVPQNYPNTLFEILDDHYAIHSLEQATDLVPKSAQKDGGQTKKQARLVIVALDLAIIYTRGLLPEAVADRWIPVEDGVWGGFLANHPLLHHDSYVGVRNWQEKTMTGWYQRTLPYYSAEYIVKIESFPRETFHFMHNLLPHQPFRYLPSGRVYDNSASHGIPIDLDEAARHAKRRRRAHILQVALVDNILGDFLEEVKRLGLYDESLIVVVADHGMSFRSDVDERIVSRRNFGSIGFVPLLIKYPNQQSGDRDERNVQITDIVPTVLDVLNVENAPETDGVSLLSPDAVMPAVKSIMRRNDEVLRFAPEEYAALYRADYIDAVDFYELNYPESTLYHYGVNLDYIGRRVDTLGAIEILSKVSCPALDSLREVDLSSDRISTLLKGSITAETSIPLEDLLVAVSVNGRVEMVTKPYKFLGQARFYVVLSDEIFREGSNDVRVHLLPDPEA